MRYVSWNVNGLRACINKGFMDFFRAVDADCFCIQETKMQPGQMELELEGYLQYWCSAEKKGYSGTAVFTKVRPLAVRYGIGSPEHDSEGRALTLDFGDRYLVTAYAPNSQDGLKRLDYRMRWEDSFRSYLLELDKEKPVIVCGDLNVAHTEIDLKNPGPNRGSAGFSDEEREKFSSLVDSGFTDTFRALHPGLTGAYTWWSYRFRARDTNAGWRIDYFLVSDRLFSRVRSSEIRSDVYGSDHCPVSLEILP
jgi:exodeoxyribonuclease-3